MIQRCAYFDLQGLLLETLKVKDWKIGEKISFCGGKMSNNLKRESNLIFTHLNIHIFKLHHACM